jgi:hypothetical protein
MGQILSSDTIYATAYLTQTGRGYLFNPNDTTKPRFVTTTIGSTSVVVDKFKITSFSMSDPDINYNILNSFSLESGDVPNITGKNEGCIKGTLINSEDEDFLIIVEDSGGISTVDTNATYVLDTKNLGVDKTLNIDLSSIPVIADEFA